MSARPDLGLTLGWMRAGESAAAAAVDRLGDDDLRGPSLLPGWSRAHVVGHLARNAEALARLAAWAHTGVETPMYRDRAQRAAEIETSAAAPASVLRAQLASTGGALSAALEELDDAGWRAEVRSALGRAIPAAEIPWMRVREVWLHAVDLGAGVAVGDLPRGVVDTLLDEAAAALGGREGCPAARLAPTDGGPVRELAPGTGPLVHGPAAELLAWLVGRGDGAALTAEPGTVPRLPPWL